ncbi:MAG: ATP-binding protein [bacterium]
MADERPTGSAAAASLAELAAILAAERPEATLPAAARLLAEISGAEGAAILVGRRDRLVAEGWHGPDALRASTRELAMNELHEVDGAPSSATLRPLREGQHQVRLSPFGVGERRFGIVALVLGDDPGRPVPAAADACARALAARWATQVDLADVRQAKAQQERWFNVLDSQLRVLDRERQKFVAVVNQSDTFMLVVDPAGKITWMNHALTDWLEHDGGARASSAMIASLWAQLALEAPEPWSSRCPIARAFRENVVVHEEFTTSSARRSLYLTFLPIKGPDGKPAEVLAMIQDLSDLEVLRRSEARYRHLFERSPDAMLMCEPGTGRILLANPVASKLTGYSAREISELTLETLHDPRDWSTARAQYESVLERDALLVCEWNLLTKDGWRIVANVCATRFDLDGRSVLLLEIRDVTQTKLLESEVRHSQKMEAIGRLAGGVAHDFNNLLSVVLGKAELLASRVSDDPKSRDTIDAIRKSALRGSLLTRRLLAFSRKEVVKREVFDLGDAVRDIEELAHHLLGERIALRTEIVAGCGILADRGQIEQVLMNLVVNARDAMPRGGTITILVHPEAASPDTSPGREALSRPDGPHVVLEVRDEGIGMDSSTQARLFEPFFTTKARGEGTGLGLSTVYGVVKECNGGIEVTSRPGEGATFTIRLPRAELAARAPDPQAGSPGSLPTSGGRILLVEDEADVRAMAMEALELEGYSVTAAASGEEALTIWARCGDSFEILLTDVMMPGISGGELARQVLQKRPNTRVLYMSGYNDDAIVRQGLSVSEADFLQKPFTLEALARKVREALEAEPADRAPATPASGSAPPWRRAQASSSSTLRP